VEAQFCIRLAGKVVGIRSMYPDLRNMCRDYETDAEADFTVTVTPQDIEHERVKSAREALIEGRKPVKYSDNYLETLAAYRKIALELLNYDTLLFHGSVIAVDGVGYLFTAKSGTGKSTHTRLWRELFGSRAVMINDDKPLLRIADGGVTAYGTPWDGKHRLSTNTSVPLKAVCAISQGETNSIEPAERVSMFPLLCQQSIRPDSPEAMAKTLSLIDAMMRGVALYRLKCNMDPEAARVAYEGMNR